MNSRRRVQDVIVVITLCTCQSTRMLGTYSGIDRIVAIPSDDRHVIDVNRCNNHTSLRPDRIVDREDMGGRCKTMKVGVQG